jgi:hypothetical protein
MGWGQDIVSRQVFIRVWAGLVNIRNDLPAALSTSAAAPPRKQVRQMVSAPDAVHWHWPVYTGILPNMVACGECTGDANTWMGEYQK